MENEQPEKLDSLINKSKHGGKRLGAGRRQGALNKATLTQREAKKQFQERVAKHVDKLFHAQIDLATGEKYLMVIETIGTGTKQKRVTNIVTDPETIKQFLDEELDNTDTEYYYMTTKPANNMALDSLLNRSFGKADESLDITTDGQSLQPLLVRFIGEDGTDTK